MADVGTRFTRSHPCPVCGCGSKGCSATTDGLHFCRGEPREGWKFVKKGDLFNCYRHESDTTRCRNGTKRAGAPKSRQQTAAIDWARESQHYAALLTEEARADLARNLGLPAAALAGLGNLGFNADDSLGPCWIFPEEDGAGRVIGLNRRFAKPVVFDGEEKTKLFVKGGRRGLSVGVGWRERTGPILLPEGASDVLALSLCGLSAVGRPANLGGHEHLAELLRGSDRDLIVLGENDARPSKSRAGETEWPGRDGARATSEQLSKVLRRPVRWAMPPEGIKDCRAWVQEIAAGFGDAEDWAGAGREILTHLLGPAAPDATCGEMIVETLAGVRPKAVAYLVPDYLPAGMMGLLAGEGGHGKSVTTLHLTACITSGRCAFGLDYPDPARGKVLVVSCEDDWQRTVVPRLAAFGADLSRCLRIKGVRMKADRQTLDFHLGHFRELERLLTTDREIRLVVIDPAGAFIGRAGVNENKDAELRTILGPLSEAANRTGATILLVKHLNKSAGVSAVQRVSGSAGYINAVRFAYMFTPDPDDAERKLMLPIKANVLKSGTAGLAYRLSPMPTDEARDLLARRWPDLDLGEAKKLSEQLLVQDWEGETTVSADVACSRRAAGTPGNTVAQCAEFIRTYLGQHTHPEKELQAAVLARGFAFKVFKSAKTELRTSDKTDPNRLSGKPRGEGGPWWLWIGPQGEPKVDRPEPDQSVPSCGSS